MLKKLKATEPLEYDADTFTYSLKGLSGFTANKVIKVNILDSAFDEWWDKYDKKVCYSEGTSKTKLDNQKKYITQTQPKYEYLRPALTNMRDNNYTYQQCADNLNLMGTLTPNNSKWCPVKVSRALIYLGVL